MPVEPGIDLKKEEVFKRLTEEQIFERYLGITVDETTTYTNPLRVDKRAGCRFYRASNGRLYFKDFSKKYHWDCFNVVQELYNCSFTDAIRIIIQDFKLNNTPVLYEQSFTPIKRERRKIQIAVRSYDQQDIDYWEQFGITVDLLYQYKVYPCKAVWLNGEYYRCKSNDPCYAYYFGKLEGIDIFKLYFPFREENRFFQNIHVEDEFLQGEQQLTQSTNSVVITKSYKDVIALSIFGIEAVAPLSEYHLITYDKYSWLSNLYSSILITGDNDSTGRAFILAHSKEYGIPYEVFPFTMEKDFTDNIKKFGLHSIKEIVDLLKQKHGYAENTST
jgi:hypothetical protein